MDLQNLFYTIAIIFMILAILILVGIAVIVFYIRKKIDDLHKFIEIRVNDVAAITLKPVEKAAHLAGSLLNPQSEGSKKRKR